MQSFAATWRKVAVIRKPSFLNMSKRLVWRWVAEPSDNAATEPEQSQKFNSRNILYENNQQLDKINSSKIVEMLRGEFRAEIGAVKSENNSLLAKLDSLQARTDGFQAQIGFLHAKQNQEMINRLETMEQRLQEMHTLVTQKMTEAIGQGQKDDPQSTEQENQRKVSGQEECYNKIMEAELEKMAKQLYENTNELLGKAAIYFESKSGWSNNGWYLSSGKQPLKLVNSDRLTVARTNDQWNDVRAKQPVSRAMLASIPTELKLAYWEVTVKKALIPHIGWIGPDFLQNDKSIGYHPGSFAIERCGNYCESGRKCADYGERFSVGDVVGTGLLLTRDNQLKMFFTLNGRLNGEPIVLKESQPDFLLYPAVHLAGEDAEVEANFGADPEKKPFKFDTNAHDHLFN